jgi:hypothetical protein
MSDGMRKHLVENEVLRSRSVVGRLWSVSLQDRESSKQSDDQKLP